MINLGLEVGDDMQVQVSLKVSSAPEEAPELLEVEEDMAFKVGVVAGEDGGLPKLCIELDGTVVATFEQTDQGRQDFWNYMDTIRVAQATALSKELQGVSIGEAVETS